MNPKIKSIFYVNYSPYENAGYIFNYLLTNAEYVYMFSIGFHHLGKKRSKNILKVFRNGKKILEKKYFHLNIHKDLEYLFVPVRSIINLFQVFSIAYYIINKYGKIDKYLSVNAFLSWAGLILKGFGFVDKTVFWVWDYYPLVHKNILVLLMRWIYWKFDKVAMYSDKIVFLNNKLAQLYKRKGLITKKIDYTIIPIGTKLMKIKKPTIGNKISIVFLGVLKKSQGLDFIFNSYKELIKKHKIILNVIGSGPDRDYFVNKAKLMKLDIKFYGNVSEAKVDSIISRSNIGVATYIPDKSNVSYFGDPSKVKRYLGAGLPVITTDVFDFSKYISKLNAGFVVKYGDIKELSASFNKIITKYRFYSQNSYNLAKKFKYTKIYNDMFKI